MVFGGDFRQVTPVVRRGSRAQISAASMRHAKFWQHAHQMRLTINMRVAGLSGLAAQLQTSLSTWLLRIGSGDEQTYPELGRDDMIRVPDDMCMPRHSGPDRACLWRQGQPQRQAVHHGARHPYAQE